MSRFLATFCAEMLINELEIRNSIGVWVDRGTISGEPVRIKSTGANALTGFFNNTIGLIVDC